MEKICFILKFLIASGLGVVLLFSLAEVPCPSSQILNQIFIEHLSFNVLIITTLLAKDVNFFLKF